MGGAAGAQGILNIIRGQGEGIFLRPSASPSATVYFRLEKVSPRKDGQRFILCVSPLYAPGTVPSPRLGGVFTHPICVMSKRKVVWAAKLPAAAAAAAVLASAGGGVPLRAFPAASGGGGGGGGGGALDLAGALADVAAQLAAMRAAIEANSELLRTQAGRICALEEAAKQPSWEDAMNDIASALDDEDGSDSLSTYSGRGVRHDGDAAATAGTKRGRWGGLVDGADDGAAFDSTKRSRVRRVVA